MSKLIHHRYFFNTAQSCCVKNKLLRFRSPAWKNNITLDPSSSFGTSSSADINVPPEGMVQRSSRIKRIQTTAMILLFFAAVINYLDRSSLSVANLTIREELG